MTKPKKIKKIEKEEYAYFHNKKIITVDGLDKMSEKVKITFDDDTFLLMYHEQECCEDVYLVDIDGDETDLNGGTVVSVNSKSKREDESKKSKEGTWTFYNIQTTKGNVWFRWFGTSNGCYSERTTISLNDDNGVIFENNDK